MLPCSNLQIKTQISISYWYISTPFTSWWHRLSRSLLPSSFYRSTSEAVVPDRSLWWFSCCEIWVLVAQPIQQKPVKLGPLATGTGRALILQEWVCVRRKREFSFPFMKQHNNTQTGWNLTFGSRFQVRSRDMHSGIIFTSNMWHDLFLCSWRVRFRHTLFTVWLIFKLNTTIILRLNKASHKNGDSTARQRDKGDEQRN